MFPGLPHIPEVMAGKQCFLHGLPVHSIKNNIFIVLLHRDGELLLVDSGCEYNGYSSDTTRVWPVNGKFTKPQRQLYEVMLKIQKNCIKVKK
jgi:Xaa-Pro aminopeptidase